MHPTIGTRLLSLWQTFLGAVFVALMLGHAPAHAQFRVDISGVGTAQLPIAITRFRDEDKTKEALSTIIRADLERSGLFKGIDAPGSLDETSQPAFNEWKSRSADALVAGSVSRLADGRYDVRFKLWDVVKGTVIDGQSSAVEAGDLRLAAHRIADVVHERLTGEKGIYSTRIAYVTKGGSRFTLRVADADADAAGDKIALNSPEPIISPAWSADGRELAYVSFESQKAVVYVQDIQSGKRRAVANFRGSNSAPAWSPDGQTLAVTLSRDGGSQIYLMGRNGDNVRRLTSSSAIDTEPTFSPDGSTIYFVSDRGGAPQIYRIPVSGGSPERVTFSGNYNISPAISPDGRLLAYVSRQGSAFKLHTMDLASGNAQAITDTIDDESPSFAPNSRVIIYATRAQGRDVLMTTTPDGKIKARLPPRASDMREPVWGPYGR